MNLSEQWQWKAVVFMSVHVAISTRQAALWYHFEVMLGISSVTFVSDIFIDLSVRLLIYIYICICLKSQFISF